MVHSMNRNGEEGIYRSKMPLAPDVENQEEIDQGVWTTGTAFRSDHGQTLPYALESRGVTLKEGSSKSLRQVASAITKSFHIPVVFAPDVFPSSKAGASKPSALIPGATPGAGAGGLEGAIGSMGVGSDTISADQNDISLMNISFRSGPLSHLLNEICSYSGLTWRYDNDDGAGRITIFRNVTRIYHINALPLAGITMSSGTSTGSNSSASSGGQNVQSSQGQMTSNQSVSINLRVWDEIVSQVNTLLDGQGTAAVSRSTGTLTVIAPAPIMDKVQRAIDTQNSILSKQVVINVEVLSVQMTDADALTFDMNAVMDKAGQYGMAIGTGGAAPAVSAAAGQAINWTSESGRHKGTQAIIQELATYGRVDVTTNTSLMTMNGIPAPLQVTHTRGYVAEVQTMSTGIGSGVSSSNSQTTLTPGSVTVGFNMLILPEVMPGGDSIMLQFSTSLSDLNGKDDGFNTFTSGNMTVQLPDVISRNFQQEATVPNGATVFLSGYEQTNDTVSKTGTGKASFIGLGGNQSGSKIKTIIVIMMTPTVLSKNVISYDDPK